MAGKALKSDSALLPSAWASGKTLELLGYGTGKQAEAEAKAFLPATPLPSPPITAEEYSQMATLCEKLGDVQGARAHRTAAAALQEPLPKHVPLQVQLNRAYQQARMVEKRLESAVTKYEQMEQALAAQRYLVLQLRSDLVEAESQHSALVRRLHDDPPGPTSDTIAGSKLSLEDLLDEQRFSAMFHLDLGDCSTVTEEEEDPLSAEEKDQLATRVSQFKTGISDLARHLFSEAKRKVDSLKAERQSPPQRMAAKKRRAGEEGQGAA
ncbi:unnamed protein product, partial [Prorocentrum cordatum]